MTTQLHYSQIDIQHAVARHILGIASELDELRQSGELHIDIAAADLFHLEALGFIVDLTTGLVTRPDRQATVVTAAEGVTQ